MSRLRWSTVLLVLAGGVYTLIAMVRTLGFVSVSAVAWVLFPYAVLGGAAAFVRELRLSAALLLVGGVVVVCYGLWGYYDAFLPIQGEKFGLAFYFLPFCQLVVCGVTCLITVVVWYARSG